MPEPTESGKRYMPGLDGIRALAVVCVIAYHLGVPAGQGGMLGVGVFFTLSGYLITDLLLRTGTGTASLGLGQFWLRRARRLLPALFLMLIVVSVWVALFDASQLGGVRRQVLAASRVRQQLVDDRPARLVLLALRRAAAARPPVVAGDRGAVLPGLAVAAAARHLDRAQSPAAGADDAWSGGDLGGGDGAHLPPRLRPDPRL